MKKLIRNALRCDSCGDEIESKYTHDFKWCKCRAIAIDGGLSYTRRIGAIDNYEELSEYEGEDQ